MQAERTERRKSGARAKSRLRVLLRDSGSERQATVLNVSNGGVALTADEPPEPGEFVELSLGRNRLAGQVRWVVGNRFGLALQEKVSVPAMLSGGDGPVTLSRMKSSAGARGSWLEGLRENPASLGRAVQFAVLGAIAGSAAWAIAHVAGESLAPVEEAAVAMHEASAR